MRGYRRLLKHTLPPRVCPPRVPGLLPAPLFLLVVVIKALTGGEQEGGISIWALVVRGDQYPDSLKAREVPQPTPTQHSESSRPCALETYQGNCDPSALKEEETWGGTKEDGIPQRYP